MLHWLASIKIGAWRNRIHSLLLGECRIIVLAKNLGPVSIIPCSSFSTLVFGHTRTLLLEPQFANLRQAIFANKMELLRFRSLVVNSVLATDIVDKDLKELRNKRWSVAFHKDASVGADNNSRALVNRKATIVIEHLIQASDVCHTMQHWHVYRKWNERFFRECYAAWKDGRATSDPSVGWYKGELGFFDFYIIPLAKKLRDCGVFGVSSDEYLQYAVKNRQEWEIHGKEVVAEMMESLYDDEK